MKKLVCSLLIVVLMLTSVVAFASATEAVSVFPGRILGAKNFRTSNITFDETGWEVKTSTNLNITWTSRTTCVLSGADVGPVSVTFVRGADTVTINYACNPSGAFVLINYDSSIKEVITEKPML